MKQIATALILLFSFASNRPGQVLSHACSERRIDRVQKFAMLAGITALRHYERIRLLVPRTALGRKRRLPEWSAP
jgi:hypothetical protein